MEKHPASALVSGMTQLLDDAGRISLTGLSGAELDAVIEDGFTIISRLTVQLVAAVEQAEAVDRPAELAAPSLVSWLRGRFGQTPRDAARLVRDMKALQAAPVAAEAALLGAIPIESASAIGHSVAELPPEVGPELRAEGADVLLRFAVGRDGPALDARELGLVGRHLHEVLDPDAADRLPAARLDGEEAETFRRRFLSITDDHDGGIRLRGLLTTEAGAILRAVLDPLAAPRPAVAASDQPDESSSSGAGSAVDDLVTDDRTGGQRLADALVEVGERALAQGDLPASGGQRPTLVVTVDHDQLAAGVGAGTLPDGGQLSPSAVARVACDAAIATAILGTRGQVLYLGRNARSASPAQRRALATAGAGSYMSSARAVTGRPDGPRPITSSTGTTSAAPTWTTWSWSAVITTEPCTTTAGRSPHPLTGFDPSSSHRNGSTPTNNPAATSTTTPATCSGHHRTDRPGSATATASQR